MTEKEKKKKPEKERLLERQAKIKARLAELARIDSDKQRKIDTRKKIVLGGAVMALQKQEKAITEESILDYIKSTSSRDKKLFGFE